MANRNSKITALILAGGRATRMGGQDKGLVQLSGKLMVEHVLHRLEPQVDKLLINANRNLDQYAALGLKVIPDTLDDFQGPLAGMLAGLISCDTPLLITAPCDSPMPPLDYVIRMREEMKKQQADIAVATDGKRQQPVFCLLRADLAQSMQDFLSAGDRKIDLWFTKHNTVEVSFEDQPHAFANINSADDLATFETLLGKS